MTEGQRNVCRGHYFLYPKAGASSNTSRPKPEVSSFRPWRLQPRPRWLFVGVLVGVGEGR